MLLAASSLFAAAALFSCDRVLADGVSASPSASTSPSPSADVTPTPAPTPTIDPAAVILDITKYKAKALTAEKAAKKARVKLAKLRKAFGKRMTSRFALAARSKFDTWQQRWQYYRHEAKRFKGWSAYYWRKMKSPKGSGAARWWPLAWYAGWPAHEKDNWIYCVTHESHGSSTAMNPIGAAGIMQIYPACKDWKNPIANITAGLRKYLADRRQGHSGWRPWTTMWSRIGW